MGGQHHALEQNKVAREWIGADNLGLFIDLGVLDNPGPT